LTSLTKTIGIFGIISGDFSIYIYPPKEKQNHLNYIIFSCNLLFQPIPESISALIQTTKRFRAVAEIAALAMACAGLTGLDLSFDQQKRDCLQFTQK
jgi:hypothetical protein